MWLVQNNVPFDVAFALDDTTRLAMCIRIGINNGRKFNFEMMQFEEEKD